MGRISIRTTFLLVLVCAVSLTHEAMAYLDPGSGSMMLQLLLGGIVGIGVIIRLYWNAFINLFRHKNRQDTPTEEDQ
jgi:hypothetical protein